MLRPTRNDPSAASASPLAEFLRIASESPSAPAILTPDGRPAVTREELVERAGEIARRLRSEPGGGGRCGLAAGNDPAFVAGLLGIWASGRVPVLLGAELTASEESEAAQRLSIPLLLRGTDAVAHRTGIRPVVEQGSARPALVKMTSGSTGLPRGVLVSERNLVAEARILCATFGIAPETRSFAVLPLSHSYGFGNLVLPLLTQGSPFVLGSPFDPRGTLREVELSGAEVLPGVPFMYDLWSRIEDPGPIPPRLRLLLSAGTLLSPAVARRFAARFGRRLATFYGTTETGPVAFLPEASDSAEGMAPVGVPMTGVEVRLHAPTPGNGEQDAGSGRIEVRSPAVALGYAPEPDASLGGGRFLADDLGRFDAEGRLLLIGRESRKIHVAGKKVQPEEVERVLCSVPGVREALVLGLLRTESTEEVVALVVRERNGACRAVELREACRAKLSPYKVPRRVVEVERIPRTPRGKVDLVAARKIAEG